MDPRRASDRQRSAGRARRSGRPRHRLDQGRRQAAQGRAAAALHPAVQAAGGGHDDRRPRGTPDGDGPPRRQGRGSACSPSAASTTRSEGLVILTNDGDFALRVAHPRYGVLARVPRQGEGRAGRGGPRPSSGRGTFIEGQRVVPHDLAIVRPTRVGNELVVAGGGGRGQDPRGARDVPADRAPGPDGCSGPRSVRCGTPRSSRGRGGS